MSNNGQIVGKIAECVNQAFNSMDVRALEIFGGPLPKGVGKAPLRGGVMLKHMGQEDADDRGKREHAAG